jgi:hypothetical protein
MVIPKACCISGLARPIDDVRGLCFGNGGIQRVCCSGMVTAVYQSSSSTCRQGAACLGEAWSAGDTPRACTRGTEW